jgi:molybdopterin biosynthesis enzyme
MVAAARTVEEQDQRAAEGAPVVGDGSARARLEEAVGGELADRLVAALSTPRAPHADPHQ